MILTAPLVFLLLGFVCFVASAFGASWPRINLQSLGLAFCALAWLWPFVAR